MYRLNHGYRKYTGNGAYRYRTKAEPEGGSDKHRGYSPVYLLKPWFNQFVARGDVNRIVQTALWQWGLE